MTDKPTYKKLEQRVKELELKMFEYKQTENLFSGSEEKYRELVQNTNSIIARIDPKGKITFFNEFAQT